MRIAVNGCGRIGKTFIRALLQDKKAQEKITLVAINVGPGDREAIAYSLKYDTFLGTFPGSLEYNEGILTIDHSLEVAIVQVLDPANAPWGEYEIDWVVECSGRFTDREGVTKHLEAGAKQVLISAPAKGEDCTIIPGVNHEQYQPKYTIVSLGSCTTNAIYPMLKILKDSFGIEQALMTTAHAYTNTQALLDVDPRVKDPRRSRAAALNIVPTSTGAMELVDKVMPDLVGKLEGSALRVPVGKVSIIDLTACLSKKASVEEVNEAVKKAALGSLKGIVSFGTEPLVSSDYAGDSHSVIIDSLLTRSLGSTVKLFGWYDNEWGYSERLKDFLLMTLK
jgi:glyceraldehyde 3-phosphate dehydrogenase